MFRDGEAIDYEVDFEDSGGDFAVTSNSKRHQRSRIKILVVIRTLEATTWMSIACSAASKTNKSGREASIVRAKPRKQGQELQQPIAFHLNLEPAVSPSTTSRDCLFKAKVPTRVRGVALAPPLIPDNYQPLDDMQMALPSGMSNPTSSVAQFLAGWPAPTPSSWLALNKRDPALFHLSSVSCHPASLLLCATIRSLDL